MWSPREEGGKQNDQRFTVHVHSRLSLQSELGEGVKRCDWGLGHGSGELPLDIQVGRSAAAVGLKGCQLEDNYSLQMES